MKLQHIAAAVALVAAGTANAAIATGGNGSLVLIAYDKTGGTTTAGVFDLGITMDDLIGSAGNGTVGATATSLSGLGSNLSWNFNTNTLSVNGVASTAYGNNAWTAAWNTLLANSDAADLQFVVTAFDSVGVGAAKRSIVTGQTGSTAVFNTTQASGLQAIASGLPQDIFTPLQNTVTGFKGTITADPLNNGAYTFTAADGAATRANGYAMAGDAFGNEWRNNNVLHGETFASDTTSLYVVDGAAKKFQLGGTLALNASTGVLSLTTSVTPAVPEPSTYALLFAGLAVVGAVTRRRRA